MLTTHGGPGRRRQPSRFVGEILEGARRGGRGRSTAPTAGSSREDGRRTTETDRDRSPLARRVMPLPTRASAGSRCACGPASSSG